MGNLTKCRTCNNEIAVNAKACPKCGAANKRSRTKLIVGVVGGLALLGAILPSKKGAPAPVNEMAAQSTPAAAPAVTPKSGLPLSQGELVEKIKAQVEGGNLFDVGTVEFVRYEDTNVSMRFNYTAKKQMSANEAEVIAYGLVTLSVKAFVAAGYNPREKNMFIRARPVQAVEQKTVTGQSQSRVFGSALYSPYADKVTYESDSP